MKKHLQNIAEKLFPDPFFAYLFYWCPDNCHRGTPVIIIDLAARIIAAAGKPLISP